MSSRRAPVAATVGPIGELPWTRRDMAVVAALIAVGGVLWSIGWWTMSDRLTFQSQVGPANVAAVGVLVIGSGQMLWFLRGRRAVDARRGRLLGTTRKARPDVTTSNPDAGHYLGAGRLFHRSGCGMADGRGWVPAPRSAHVEAGRVPCGMCAP